MAIEYPSVVTSVSTALIIGSGHVPASPSLLVPPRLWKSSRRHTQAVGSPFPDCRRNWPVGSSGETFPVVALALGCQACLPLLRVLLIILGIFLAALKAILKSFENSRKITRTWGPRTSIQRAVHFSRPTVTIFAESVEREAISPDHLLRRQVPPHMGRPRWIGCFPI